MAKKRQDHFLLQTIRKPEKLDLGDVACLLNAILVIVHNLQCKKKVPFEEITKLFAYSSKDGIYSEPNKYQRLDTKLENSYSCLCKLYHKNFKNKEELIDQLLTTGLPVPIFFDIDVLSKIEPQITKITGYTLGITNTGTTYGFHILLLVGYDNIKNELKFIDPNYMLPYYDYEHLNSDDNIIRLSTEDFWRHMAKNGPHSLKQYIQIQCSKKDTKKIKNDLTKYS